MKLRNAQYVQRSSSEPNRTIWPSLARLSDKWNREMFFLLIRMSFDRLNGPRDICSHHHPHFPLLPPTTATTIQDDREGKDRTWNFRCLLTDSIICQNGWICYRHENTNSCIKGQVNDEGKHVAMGKHCLPPEQIMNNGLSHLDSPCPPYITHT